MIRNNIYSILLCLTAISLCARQGQAQDLARWRDDWRQFQSRNIQEKLYVHSSKTFFLAGETLWLKIYDVDAATNKPLSFSTIAYLELIDKSQRPALQARIELKDGNGAGSLRLPVTLPSGNYLLRCYTSWMKNFNPDLYFHQQITVVNTFRNAGSAEASPSSRSIRFFPEGGNLVYGLPSRVAFQLSGDITDVEGLRGFILDQKRDTIAIWQPDKMGTGSFSFTPVSGNSYQAHIQARDSSFTAPLPTPYDKGYVMQLTETADGRLRITVQTTIRSSMPIVYLLAHTGGQLYDVQSTAFSNNMASFYIDKRTLREGITHFTVFDDQRAPVCERLYFTRPVNPMVIDATLSSTSLGTRKRGDLTLTTSQAGHTITADLSLSIFLLDSLQDIPTEDIKSYLLLSSELNGTIRDPRYYLEDSSAEAQQALDNLLLTQGWSRFRWEEVLQHKQPYFEFLPEINGPHIAGRLVDRRTGAAGPPTMGYLSIPGKSFLFGAAQSRPDGSILFDMKNFYGSRDIIVQTNSQTADSNYRIDITSPFSDKPSLFTPSPSRFSPSLANVLLSRSIAMQAENSYLYKDKHRFVPVPEEDTIPFYGITDHDYRLDDYTRFQTLEEVMREYVSEVKVREQSGGFHYRVRNNLFNLFFEDDPLVLVDGVPAFNINKMLTVDPLKIQQVQIVARKFYTGPLVSDGIVSYRTYDGDLGGYQLDPNTVAIHYEGIQLQQEFYTPGYDNGSPPSPRIPDFRNQLQWSPDLHTGDDGKATDSFYTSDVPGTYLIFVQGITEQGQPGSKIMTFTVH